MAGSFLDYLRQHGVQGPLPKTDCGGPAAQGVRSGEGSTKRGWDFAFATGIECSNPLVVDSTGRRIRRDLLEECGPLSAGETICSS